MLIMRRYKIREHERGLCFRDGEFKGLLRPGVHWIADPLFKVSVDVLSVREPWIERKDLDVIVKSGALKGEAVIVDLKDHERALVWIDGRFASFLTAGLHALWTSFHDVQAEVVDARTVRFEHEQLAILLKTAGAKLHLDTHTVEAGHAALYFLDGRHQATLEPGTYAFWKGMGTVAVRPVELRESVLDVPGQEIMTADKVTLRINAVVTYKVTDPLRVAMVVEDPKHALYRDAQLALRAVIGTRELDELLGRKDEVANELEGLVRARAAEFGVQVLALGIRDVILPGEMKELLNKVTEARKAAEASLITRREETAAMRSQANTAKILESNPTLMRLRELEVLEKVAEKANLNVVLGEQGLADRVVKLL
jgi:regulator of protease activity HflC (stomatin/prohibitin superfamily)